MLKIICPKCGSVMIATDTVPLFPIRKWVRRFRCWKCGYVIENPHIFTINIPGIENVHPEYECKKCHSHFRCPEYEWRKVTGKWIKVVKCPKCGSHNIREINHSPFMGVPIKIAYSGRVLMPPINIQIGF
ncbi:MAG: hypothetical protein DRN49_00805 [Thaumarchaeota archaeon]|nr:MAG: hypothetical protein DRN49_00805 [Nitrososphaerota archaeon]